MVGHFFPKRSFNDCSTSSQKEGGGSWNLFQSKIGREVALNSALNPVKSTQLSLFFSRYLSWPCFKGRVKPTCLKEKEGVGKQSKIK